MNHLEKPNRFRISKPGDFIEQTIEIMIVPDSDYHPLEGESPIENPCGIVVTYVKHNWRTGNHLEFSSAGVWGFDYVYSDKDEIVACAREQFNEMKTDSEFFPILNMVDENAITAERINHK